MTATAKKATGIRRTMSCPKYPSRCLRRGLDEMSVFSALEDAVAFPPIVKASADAAWCCRTMLVVVGDRVRSNEPQRRSEPVESLDIRAVECRAGWR